MTQSPFSSSGANFQLINKVEVCSDGTCQLMACPQNMGTIAVSVNNPNPIGGNGVKRISAFDYTLSEFIPIHSEVITDMCFKPNESLLLTASMDKTMRLTSLIDKSVCATFSLSHPARSCCWHPTNSNVCFVGLNSGDIHGYDIRYPSVPAHKSHGISTDPLIAMQSVNKKRSQISQGEKSFTGLLCNNLTTFFFVNISQPGNIRSKKPLPLGGDKFLPAHYDQESGNVLISIPPSRELHVNCIRHRLFNLKKNESDISSVIVHEFSGGAQSQCVSKSKVFTNSSSINAQPYVFAVDEQNNGILLYDTESRKIKQVIKNRHAIRDIGLVSSTSQLMRIAALTERGITFYDKKFTN